MTDPATSAGNGLTYRDAGVDIDRGNRLVEAIKPLARSTARPGADAALGGFGGLFDLKAAGFDDPILVAANDGVGTKLKIAIEAGVHDTIGIDLVAMCVNDLIVQGAEPLFFLDYLSTGRLDDTVAEAVIAGIADGCRQAGCALIGGETAEMPGMYADGDYDLAGFAVGAAERGGLLPREDIAPGDVLLGLASNGLHSNGFSLVRRIVALSGAALGDAAPFAGDQTLAEALLRPTRIYVKPVLAAYQTGHLKAAAHITGGGLTENVPRALPTGTGATVDETAWPRPAVFDWLAKAGGVEARELARTFNCGIGMVLIVAEDAASTIQDAVSAHDVACYPIGSIVAADGEPTVEIRGQG